jgi:hypothetical protein
MNDEYGIDRERMRLRTIECLGRENLDFTRRASMPRAHKMNLKCNECGTGFRSSKLIPECPQCNGSDIDLA